MTSIRTKLETLDPQGSAWPVFVIDLFVALGALVLRPHISSTAAIWVP